MAICKVRGFCRTLREMPQRAVILIAIFAVLVSPARGAAPGAAPLTLEYQLVNWTNTGQFRKIYDTFPPQQQKVIRYRVWRNCVSQAAAVGKRIFGIKSMRFISAKLLPGTKVITLSGTNVRLPATVVRVTESEIEGGKRTTWTSTDAWVQVTGKWYLPATHVVGATGCS